MDYFICKHEIIRIRRFFFKQPAILFGKYPCKVCFSLLFEVMVDRQAGDVSHQFMMGLPYLKQGTLHNSYCWYIYIYVYTHYMVNLQHIYIYIYIYDVAPNKLEYILGKNKLLVNFRKFYRFFKHVANKFPEE